MAAIDHVIVVIPAHNEEDRIQSALLAVNHARSSVRTSTTSIVVCLDRCTDRTASRTRSLLSGSDLIIEINDECVGSARRAGTAAGLDATSVRSDRVWIASTDADSVVAEDWLTQQLDLASAGAAAVAGIVALTTERCKPALLQRFVDSYPLRSDGTHPHVHGANLGVRADAYLTSGGWSALATGEDHDLWNRIRRVGYPTVSSTSLVVGTSSRVRGRAPAGFARDLSALATGVL